MNAPRPTDQELARAREVAGPYLALIRDLLDGRQTVADFALDFEEAWDAQEGAVPDLAYEPLNHLAARAESHNPQFAAEGDRRYCTDDDVIAAARATLDQLRSALG